MTVPQKSYGFANGRTQVLSKTLLSAQAIERLVALDAIDDVARALTELGWAEVRSKGDIERAAARSVEGASKFVRDITPDEAATDCFLIRYDALNLKLLFKGRILHENLSALNLSGNGLIAVDRLSRMVSEARYADLPIELREAMEQIEKRTAVQMDPLFVDAAIDKATWRYIARRLGDTRDEVVKAYFVHRAELINLTIALRAASLGKGSAFARELFVPYGTLTPDALAPIADEPEKAASLASSRPYYGAVSGILKSLPIDLSALERASDDHLLSLFRHHKYDNATVLPLIGYLLAREREAGALRLIVTAKTSNVDRAQLLARLRTMY